MRSFYSAQLKLLGPLTLLFNLSISSSWDGWGAIPAHCVELAGFEKEWKWLKMQIYNELSKRCAKMENKCIYLEIKVQQYKESFQNNQLRSNQDIHEFLAFFEINELKAQLEEKNNSISKLKDHIATLKGKGVSKGDKYANISKVLALGMYKLDLELLSPMLLRNKEAHVDYLKYTQEHADTLREIVEHARALRPLDSDLDSAYKFTTRVQELLAYVRDTCPSSSRKSEKLIAVTPINKVKKVRFVEPSTSSSNTHKQVDSFKTKDSNTPLLPSTGHSILNANSELICATCNECMFDAIHDLCVLDYVNDVNVRSRTFTIDGNTCPLTRITSTTVVPPKKPISTTLVKKTLPNSNTSGKLKDITNIGCSKHITGQRSQLINFVSKFMGTIRFGNDHVVEIKGLRDYEIGNVTIYRVYYVEGLDHNLFSVGQFCDSDLEVAFQKHSCYVHDLEGVDLLKGLRGSNLYTMSLEEMMKSSPICLLLKSSKTKSWLWHKRLSHLNFGKSKKHTYKPKSDDSIQEKLYLLHMDLYGPMRIESINEKKYILVIVDDYSRFTWAEAVATTCYTQNRSLIRRRHNKTPYELIHDRKPDLTYFHVFGALYYPTNDGEDLGKLKPKADIGIFIGYAPAKKAYRIYNRRTCLIMETIHVKFDELTTIDSEQFGSRPELQLMTHGTINSGLVQNPPSTTPYVPPTKNDWDLLFQPMFDEYFNPPPSVVSPVPVATAPRPDDPTGSPSSTSIDQAAPSANTKSTIQKTQSLVILTVLKNNYK
ncbi:retrovirus-related pol polyprotein from transposon TNT 1-94 [Tanacetum coccineum]